MAQEDSLPGRASAAASGSQGVQTAIARLEAAQARQTETHKALAAAEADNKHALREIGNAANNLHIALESQLVVLEQLRDSVVTSFGGQTPPDEAPDGAEN